MSHLMVDIDEVLFGLIDQIHRRAQVAGYHDGSVPPTWRGWEAYGCSEAAYWDLWADFALEGGYVSTPPIPGSLEALRQLYWQGHTIHLVTARGYLASAQEIRAWTQEWVAEFAVPHHTLTFARDKVAAQDDLGVRFDFAIDDSPRNYQALDAAGVEVYLHDHAHNIDQSGFRRVPDLEAWARIIDRSTK